MLNAECSMLNARCPLRSLRVLRSLRALLATSDDHAVFSDTMLVFMSSIGVTRCLRVAAAFAAAFLACANLGIAADPGSDAPSAPLWMRYPAISPDGKTIAFSFEGHLFTIPVTGGTAQALTAGPAH